MEIEEQEEEKQSNLLMKKRVYQQGLENHIFKKKNQKPSTTKKEKKQVQHRERVPGRVGLRNLGNTCYLNSVIQCLSNIQPLTEYCKRNLYKQEINKENFMGSQGLIATAFANLINQIWDSEKTAVEPLEFYKIIQHVKPEFGNNTQEDAQEFLIFLLDYLHEDLNRVKKKPYVEEKEYTKELTEQEQELLAANSWKDYLQRNKSVIVDLFQGQLKNSIMCKECKFQKYNFEPFMYLSLPLEEQNKTQRISVKECLEQFLQEEHLENSEQWDCPRCKKKTNAIKKIDLWKLPNILMIMFKRFRYDTGKGRKVNSVLSFETDQFSLTEFVPKELQKEEPAYDLISALCHRGQLSYGHYYAYAKNKNNFEWYSYDDSRTGCIQNPEKQIAGSSAYMLMYQKCTNALIRQQSITDPKNWPHYIQLQNE